jgi:hypothetical protein
MGEGEPMSTDGISQLEHEKVGAGRPFLAGFALNRIRKDSVGGFAGA